MSASASRTLCGTRSFADAGVQRGLIGPREVPRLWERHILNCAVPPRWSLKASPSATWARRGAAGHSAGPGPAGSQDHAAGAAAAAYDVPHRGRRAARARSRDGGGRAPRRSSGSCSPSMSSPHGPWRRSTRLAAWGVPLLRPYGEMLAPQGRHTAGGGACGRRRPEQSFGAVETSVLHAGEGVVDPRSTVVRVEVGERAAVCVVSAPSAPRRLVRDGRAAAADRRSRAVRE